ncbi:hypothetical protein SCHPADRAFT_831467 [Schizopora paradoxa]|uniref:Right handed beta helix domain-containing protein n=1 Tax=Schizopora paradoxa TaxID=27342 RepID=A0A0H2RP29_9AGAM|nr:hypothetical protein SCHPADRAFT_831467 [Schizopora paradoxa]
MTRRDDSSCFDPSPVITITDRMNTALNSSGAGYILSLCPSTIYPIVAPLVFKFPDQEISTQGYPTGDERATLVIQGPVFNGTGHTTAIDGTGPNCDGAKIRHIQINGTRLGGTKLNGGANIEMGNNNADQLIEYVRSYDPRSWSCMHVTEGSKMCSNATVQNNDVGPCGLDGFNQWADGISYSCWNGLVQNNMINNPTDGGIVLFGAPGTLVRNNTIWIEKQTLLGGINLVDYGPFNGSFTGVVVENNTIFGGFADGTPTGNETKGDDEFDAIIKMGIAIGPRTWFGNHYGNNVSFSAIVRNNQFTGAFGYGIAMSGARNFTVEGNTLIGNTSFIGSRGPNCSSVDQTPTPAAFVMDQNTVTQSTTQSDFVNIQDGDTLTCIEPPTDGDYWPFGGNPGDTVSSSTSSSSSHSSTGRTVGLVLGILGGILFVAALSWFVRKRALTRMEQNRAARAQDADIYTQNYKHGSVEKRDANLAL